MGTRIRTTINPAETIEVGDAELLDLRRQGVIFDFPDGDPADRVDDETPDTTTDGEQPDVTTDAGEPADVPTVEGNPDDAGEPEQTETPGVDVADGTARIRKGR